MTVPPVCLDAGDAAELGELLEFLADWLVGERSPLAESLRRFLGVDGYEVDELRADVSRFSFLLGVNDGELLFGGDER
jgi:hypothetical protein